MADTVYQCDLCGDTFRAGGVHLSVHDKTVSQICPSCIHGVTDCNLRLHRDTPAGVFKCLGMIILEEEYEDGA